LKKSADSESFILVTGIMGCEEISRRILENAERLEPENKLRKI